MQPDRVAIAAVLFGKGDDVDGLLLDVVTSLTRAGVRLGGLVQLADGGDARRARSVQVVDLRSGARYEIWDPRGQLARGCRLDESGLALAEVSVLASLNTGIELLILNRFGRAESMGRGLMACFAKALGEGVPILTAVRAPFDQEWNRFHGGLATSLPLERRAVLSWTNALIGKDSAAGSSTEPALAVSTYT
jgi:hypothetical protein